MRTSDPVARSRWLIAAALGIACAGCLALLTLRTRRTEYFALSFVKNLFLAALPFPLAWVCDSLERHDHARLALIPGAAWLAFFPNAPYLVTDVIHLRPSKSVPLWFEGVTFAAFGATGLLLAYVSLYLVQSAVRRRFGERWSFLFAAGSLLACGYGVYLGRIERWNSWDVVGRPAELASSVRSHLLRPLHNLDAVLLTGFIAVFLLVGYGIITAFAAMIVADDREAVSAAASSESDTRA